MGLVEAMNVLHDFIRQPTGALCPGIRQQYGKLLASITGHQISRPVHALLQGMGNGNQALIALQMAIVIVVALEEIDIEQQQRKRP